MWPATSGTQVPLLPQSGKYLVLYFYPKDCTSGCTVEGHEFNGLLKKFKDLKTEVYGVSRDTLKLHEKFKEKEGYNFELISDGDEELCKIFDVIKEKNMYGKKVMGIERSTFVLNQQGEVVAEWRKVKAEGHAADVFEKIKELGA
jgi:peroxiredoxin Q/BCP